MTKILLSNVNINFGFKKILNNVSFEINTGDKAAIVGGNGSGKTTILRLICGLESVTAGTVTIQKGMRLGYLEQESDAAEAEQTVEVYLKEAQQPVFDIEVKMRTLEGEMAEADEKQLSKILSEYDRLQNQFTTMGGYQTEELFNRICIAFKISSEMLKQMWDALSGGQKTRIKLAKVLLQQPDILLLDEPTNHIDISTLEWLEQFICEYPGTVVMVSHDRYFMDKTVTKTIMLEGDGAHNPGSRAEIYRGNYSYSIAEQERRMLAEFEQYKSQQKQIEAMEAAIKRYQVLERGTRTDVLRRRINRLERMDNPLAEKDKLKINFEMKARSGKRVLTIKDMCFAYGERVLFENAALEILFRERVCLMGDNGSGKTTLINLLLGNLTPDAGEVMRGESVKLGYIEQEVSFPNEKETVLEMFKRECTVHEKEARHMLARYFYYGDAVHKRLDKLSGGERVIIKLALLMERDVNFLILDEPTNHLDIAAKEVLEEALAGYKGTLLFVSHDRYFINKVASRCVRIEGGGVR
ncbi:MAG: ATP-binding cassette domain-containing protein [Defluviitaleaceae bacterium]|nr:ATP-binding cassette domain-containing protein [Defluviitaleaceae bacterium]